MAKRRLAEHFRENRLGLLRQCGFKSATRPRHRFYALLVLFGASCRFRKMLMYLFELNQTIGSRGTPNLLLSDRRRMESRTAPAFARPYVIFGFSYRSLMSFSLPRLREWLPPVRRNPAERRALCWRSIRYPIRRPAG